MDIYAAMLCLIGWIRCRITLQFLGYHFSILLHIVSIGRGITYSLVNPSHKVWYLQYLEVGDIGPLNWWDDSSHGIMYLL